jgi:hypothetical protein
VSKFKVHNILALKLKKPFKSEANVRSPNLSPNPLILFERELLSLRR